MTNIAPYREHFNVCAVGFNGLRIDGLLRHVLTTYFSDDQNIKTLQLKGYVFRDDPTTTRIRIEPVYKWDPQLADKTPAIIIKRGQIATAPATINVGEITTYGIKVAGRIWQGSSELICISRNPAEAELLAEEVASIFWVHGSNIARYLRAQQLMVTNISPLQLITGSPVSLTACVVGLQYTFMDAAHTTSAGSARVKLNISYVRS